MVNRSINGKDPAQLSFDWVQTATTALFNQRFQSKALFLLKPPQPVGEQIFADTCRHAGGRTHREAYPADLLHITLFCVGCFRTLPEGLLGRIQKAMDEIRARPIPVALDRSAIFGDRASLVLKSSYDTVEIEGLSRILQRHLRKKNLPFVQIGPSVPHITTIYGCGNIDTMPITQPYCWTADNFELVFSHYGQTRHEELGRWSLSTQADDYERPARQLAFAH
ncbi:2'-5' RNA ligase [Agrobacterium tumefaciens]|uniref:2'-5' RNA ligase family protein n=1 Tax=Agrobacterium tumefaciens TaxID=358 RepID=UPI00287D7474|nr:2'-5' RNA ligase [Agrobacterium tumefaciens]MDS7595938.1 2'-5' RNA ligase [Agrobacterium tumefaciens]